MKFALIMNELTNEQDRIAILEYLERQKGYPGMNDSVKSMNFAVRRSNGLTFDRIDIYVNRYDLILPLSLERDLDSVVSNV